MAHYFFELMFLESRFMTDLLLTMELLQLIQPGFFEVVILAASTWSRHQVNRLSAPEHILSGYQVGMYGLWTD